MDVFTSRSTGEVWILSDLDLPIGRLQASSDGWKSFLLDGTPVAESGKRQDAVESLVSLYSQAVVYQKMLFSALSCGPELRERLSHPDTGRSPWPKSFSRLQVDLNAAREAAESQTQRFMPVVLSLGAEDRAYLDESWSNFTL